MRNTLLLTLSILFISFSGINAQVTDSIYIKMGAKKEKIISHTIKGGETLYSIAPFYGLMPQNILKLNPELDQDALIVGQTIKIPLPNIAIRRYKTETFISGNSIPLFYKVQRGETLYTIAKKYFRMPIDTVMSRNALPDYRLSIGRELHIGWMDINGVPDSIQAKIKRTFTKKMFTEEDYKKKNAEVLDFDQQGIAYWQKNTKSGGGSLTLHRTEPIGSTITIINPMTKKKLRTKVVGRIPDSRFARDVILVISPNTAKRLGAVDERFYVKVKF